MSRPRKWSTHVVTFGRRSLNHIALSSAAGGLLGGLDGALSARGQGALALATGIWVGIGTLALLAVPLGVVQALVEAALGRSVPERLTREWRELVTRASRGGQESFLIRAYAGAALCAGALAFVVSMTWVIDAGLAAIQDFRLRRILLVLAVGILVAVAALLLLVLEPPLSRLLVGIHRRGGSWWSTLSADRFVVHVSFFVLLPSFGIAAALLSRYGGDLTIFTRPIGFFLWLEFELLIFAVVRWLAPPARRALIATALVFGTLTIVVVPIAAGALKHGKSALAAGIFAGPAVSLLSRATDLDGDGFSNLYLGGDCEPRNASVHVAALDVPANGVDENCDGVDTPPGAPIERGAVFSGTLPPEQTSRYNVLWIVVDAMRPASMELYGGRRGTTPALLEFSRSSLVFESAYAQSTITHLSLPCMLLGKTAGSITWEYTTDPRRLEASDQHLTLAERLHPLGYSSVAIASRFVARLSSILRGFNQVITNHRVALRHDGPATTHAAIAALHEQRRSDSRPLFLFLYYEDPHKPYEAHGPEFPSFGSGDRDLYEGEIAFVDRYLGFLFEHLRADRAFWDQTIVIVTADHGEEFGEHGGFTHAKNCREASARVPLLVKVPGVPAKRVLQRVSLVDIVPTVLELVGAGTGVGDLDGRSLLTVLDANASPAPSFCTITNQGSTLRGKSFYQQSVRFGTRTLIRDLMSGETALFDVGRDPAEKWDRADEPEEAQTVQYLKHLLDWNATGNLLQKRLDN